MGAPVKLSSNILSFNAISGPDTISFIFLHPRAERDFSSPLIVFPFCVVFFLLFSFVFPILSDVFQIDN